MMWGSRFLAAVIAASITWWATSLAKGAIATPAKVFQSYLPQMQQQLPPGFAIRLPAKILLGGPADDEFIDSLQVKIGRPAPEEVTIDLLSCGNERERCWIGSFAVSSTGSAKARREYYRHLDAATPIRLSQAVRAYVRDNLWHNSATTASSVMWEQNGMFYTVKFASPERQNMLYMALSMVNSDPIYALNPYLRDLPAQSGK